MDNPKISILIPIYNVEKYLEQCLKSVTGQTLKDIEILCINDGSTDGCLNIINKYAKADKRVIVIDKKNSGYGDSMNIGLKKSSGEYIGIVEPDDWVEADTFETLYNLAKNNGSEIVRAEYFKYKNGINEKTDYFKEEYVAKNINAKKIPELFQDPPAIWSAIYDKKFLDKNEIFFLPTEGASYQDTGFYYKTLACVKKIRLTKQAFLHYRMDNEESSVKNTKKIFSIVKEHDSIQNFLEEKKMEEFLPVIQPAKFANYHWNIQRLPGKSAKKFIFSIRPEFIDAKKRGLLDKKYFSKKYWIAVNLLIKAPGVFFILSRVASKSKS